uniref:Uncharacterized protein n=1 Tax=Oryza meridionalis TaxID=40149 RepID=A0A0E0DF54_9ORYZ
MVSQSDLGTKIHAAASNNMMMMEAAQGVASMRTEEPQRLTKERPPKASLGSLGIQEQRQEVAQHQGQEQGKQDHKSSQHKLSSHHLTYSLTPGTTTPCSSYLNLISQQEAWMEPCSS